MISEKNGESIQAHLSQPGKGLPLHEGLFLKYVVLPSMRSLIGWDKAMSMFEREGEKILRLIESQDEHVLFERVLIPKIIGIEDNSRYYSPAMVLWHLQYVGMAIQDGIVELSHGNIIDITVRIADFKPFVPIEKNIVQQYEIFLYGYRKNIENRIGDKYAPSCHTHPWFGCMNPYRWLIMSLAHQFVHRRQIEAIIQRC